MADFRVEIGFFRHHKIEQLEELAGAEGVLGLLRIWAYVAEFRPATGDLAGISDRTLERKACWGGEPGGLLEALADCVLIEGGPGERRIHGWAEWQPFLAGSDTRRERGRAAALARWRPQAPKRAPVALTTRSGERVEWGEAEIAAAVAALPGASESEVRRRIYSLGEWLATADPARRPTAAGMAGWIAGRLRSDPPSVARARSGRPRIVREGPRPSLDPGLESDGERFGASEAAAAAFDVVREIAARKGSKK